MFQFPRLPPCTLFHSGAGSGALPPLGSPIRESPDRRPFAPPRGLSQLAAPFFGFLCQGIRRAPLTSSLDALGTIFKSVDEPRSIGRSMKNRIDPEYRIHFAFAFHLVSLSLCGCQGARRARARAQGRPRTGPWKPDAAVGGGDARRSALFLCEIVFSIQGVSLERR